MKNTTKLFGLATFITALIFFLASCGGPSGVIPGVDSGAFTGTYTGSNSNVTYALTINPALAKAAEGPLQGDSYELLVTKTGTEQKSAGKVSGISGSVLEIQPDNKGSPSFKVTVSGNKITNITGLITFNDGTTLQGPGTFTSGGNGGGTGGGTGNGGGGGTGGTGGGTSGGGETGGSTPTPVPPAITTTRLNEGIVEISYSQTLTATGDTPITWNVESGTLPPGLELSTAGTITGTPTTVGTSTFTIKASNSAGSDIKSMTITVRLKEIEEKYRFSNGDWDGMYDTIGSGKITVSQTSITTTTDINLSGIYSSGGGSTDSGGTWAYLYDDSGKIGIIYDITIYDITYFIYVNLGKTYISEGIDHDDFSDFSPIPDSSDMKDSYNGNGYYNYFE